MAATNHERVGRALELLRAGLGPFVRREVQQAIKSRRLDGSTLQRFVESAPIGQRQVTDWDVQLLLKLMWETWNEVFRETLGRAERSFVAELRDHRNRWAHQARFSSDDAYRVLDTANLLLTAVSATQATDVERLKMELLRVRFDEQARGERRKQASLPIGSAATGGLKSWREVVAPHQDVASGRYQQAEFAADLWQVHLNEGTPAYRDPVEFYRRTYLTQSLRGMLVGAVRRLAGRGGDPVVQLQTNFGGGKTHSMLALYHLFSGTMPGELEGIEAVLQEADATSLPSARRVVLVGNKISPGNPVTKPDGTVVRTLWGELAWQMGGARAYARVADDDKHATSPGDRLRQILADHGPCLILIDEWVAYARQLHDQSDLPAGSFETQFTFAQALTESAKAVGNCLLVISLPASDTTGFPHAQLDDVEVGGHRGREALERLRNVVGRVESSWRPASAEEGFEIVRRRLFEPLAAPEQFKDRDVVAQTFARLYRTAHQEFPSECRDADYEKRLRAAYPIHPEIFDRLYTDWSTLVTFQRTRGVLRLMAAVIHSLWEKGDRNPLILPAHLSIDDPQVLSELTRYLPDNWTPVIEKDVDGQNALPQRIDSNVAALGKFSACRRVARALYLGSAPTAGAAHRGLDDRRIKLGCVLPGETPAVFGDALRRLAASATYLYQDGSRYWYDTRATVTKLAEDRAEQLRGDEDRVAQAISAALRDALKETGGFRGIHRAPESGHDVPDERETRLVVLGTEHPHQRSGDSPAETAANDILKSRGAAPRLYCNCLVFLAPDKTRLQDLDDAVRRHIAWSSIVAEREALNLSPNQVKQAETQVNTANQTVEARLPETYQWLLAPVQDAPTDPITLEATRLTGKEGLAARVAERLRRDDVLAHRFAGTRLRLALDQIPLWRGNHVAVQQLIEDFAQYPYLPRLLDPAVLLQAVADGVGLVTWIDDSFGYADSFDEQTGRYVGLRGGQIINLNDEYSAGLIVKADVAQRQIDAEKETDTPRPPYDQESEGGVTGPGRGPSPPLPPAPRPARFHGTVGVDAARTGRDAGRISEEVVAHLAGLTGASVTVTIEIDAAIPNGAPDHVVRTVTENCRTLKFSSQGFESE